MGETTATEPIPEGGHEHAHPGVAEYVKIAVVLAVITAAEVALYYTESVFGEGPTTLGLMVMMAAKFALVVMWFMHLKFDSPLFRRLFVAGVILAMAIYAVVLVQMIPHVSLPFR